MALFLRYLQDSISAFLDSFFAEGGLWGHIYMYSKYCTKPLSTIQCNKTLCQDQLDPYYS